MVTTPERFWAKVDKADATGCWLWTGGRTVKGYGQLSVDGRKRLAHRYAYELLVGPIPEGLTVDHRCRVPACVNPAHLDPVTMRANNLRSESNSAKNVRKTHCPAGHAYDVVNTRRDKHGKRRCRACQREQYRARYRRDRGVVIPMASRTHCPQGHPYDKANTWVDKGGGRHCRECKRAANRRWAPKRRAS